MSRRDEYPDTECFKWHNQNPKGRLADDCVLRAVSLATGLSWDDTLDKLVEIAHKRKDSPVDMYPYLLESLGFEKQKQYMIIETRKKITAKQMCELWNRRGKNVVIVANATNHLICIKQDADGKHKVWDTWDCTDCAVGNWWVREVE